MKRLKLAVTAFTLAAVICALAYLVIDRAYGRVGGPELSLWYIRSDCADSALSELRVSYSVKARGGSMPVSLRGFETEAELAAALETEVPDMLLCSHLKAGDLEQRGLLTQVEPGGGAYPEELLEAMPASGRSFFPIGAKVGVLIFNKGLCSGMAEPESFEALARQCSDYAAENGAPFLSAQSYGDLVNALMCSLEAPFSGDLHEDAANASFKRVYNLLAGCGYEHALAAPDGGCAQSVVNGELSCAFVPSTALASLNGKGISVMALPLPEGGKALCPAELMGIAVTCGKSEDLPSVTAFLAWLSEDGRGDSLAVASALAPLGTGASERGFFWEKALGELSARQLVYPSGDSGFPSRRAEFDAAFSEALDLLQ